MKLLELSGGNVHRMLECTRQNLSYIVNQGRLVPIKNETKGNLYLKGDIKRTDSYVILKIKRVMGNRAVSRDVI